MLLTFAMVVPGIAVLLYQNKHIIEHQHELGVQMGVVAITLGTIQGNIDEFAAESKATLEAALAKDVLDADDKAAIEALLKRSQELKDIVPDAVTIPLPDPENTVGLNPTQEGVLDPATVTPETISDGTGPVVSDTAPVEQEPAVDTGSDETNTSTS